LAALVVAVATDSLCAAPPITAAAFAPDGKTVVLGSQAGLELRTWPALETLRTIETPLENVHDLAFSPDGVLLAVAGGSPADTGEVQLLSWRALEERWRVAPHEDVVYSVAWSADGATLATAAGDRIVKVLAADDGAALLELTGHSRPVRAVAFAEENALVSAGVDGTLRLWNAADGHLRRSLEQHTGAVHALALRPGRPPGARPQMASIGADRTVRFWEPTIGRMMRFARVPSEPLAAAWTADGERLAVACADGRVRAIDPATAANVAELDGLMGASGEGHPPREGEAPAEPATSTPAAVEPPWAYTLVRGPGEREFLVAGGQGQVRRIEMPE
jgi:WD40 repeat protein